MVAVEHRLDALLDRGSLQLLHPQDDSGVLGGRGALATRRRLAAALAGAPPARGAHRNIPL
ncbi:hypothetical protein KZZ52_51880 [Dactylosporangium sp. AC04546]|uniref:hypothetical protein n=1 Tax=Dactylosporangium sp. AC04546 TaxID=2862460 RepID=UPI001EDEB40D|nr:hypothetical protein [Dactylosporangium sp. AC04546]WVK82362.1 hypothetical protein KZZ52_51880 [Dactylosporangium sp. AC04546]